METAHRYLAENDDLRPWLTDEEAEGFLMVDEPEPSRSLFGEFLLIGGIFTASVVVAFGAVEFALWALAMWGPES